MSKNTSVDMSTNHTSQYVNKQTSGGLSTNHTGQYVNKYKSASMSTNHTGQYVKNTNQLVCQQPYRPVCQQIHKHISWYVNQSYGQVCQQTHISTYVNHPYRTVCQQTHISWCVNQPYRPVCQQIHKHISAGMSTNHTSNSKNWFCFNQTFLLLA